MNRCFILILSCLLVLSCTKEQPLTFQLQEINAKQLQACMNKSCPSIQVDYALANSTNNLAGVINPQIERSLGQLISSSVMPDGELLDQVKPAVDAFVHNFQDYMGDFPNGVMEYQLDIDSHVSYQTQTLFSVATDFYIYTGGAHGYGGVQFINMDAQTGQILTWPDLINDLEGFTAMAQAKFKSLNNIPENDAINSTGFWFEDDVFVLPESYGFTQEGLEFVYNTYEISSYVAGPQRMVIPFNELEPWLNAQTSL